MGYNIYQLFEMNHKELPFMIKNRRWGNLTISVDKIENIRFSGGGYYCDAYTLSEDYRPFYGTYGTNENFKKIGNAGTGSWYFAEYGKLHDEELITRSKKKHKKGLLYRKAKKNWVCFFCQKIIEEGQNYERYSVRNANKVGNINEPFCIGHRDKMRENYFKKSIDEISFKEIMECWRKGILM